MLTAIIYLVKPDRDTPVLFPSPRPPTNQSNPQPHAAPRARRYATLPAMILLPPSTNQSLFSFLFPTNPSSSLPILAIPALFTLEFGGYGTNLLIKLFEFPCRLSSTVQCIVVLSRSSGSPSWPSTVSTRRRSDHRRRANLVRSGAT